MMTRFRLSFLLPALLTLATAPMAARAGVLHPALERQLADKSAQETLQVLVSMKNRVDIRALDTEIRAAKADRAARNQRVLTELRSRAARSQRSLLAELDVMRENGEVLGYTPHWLVNGVVVTATPDAIRDLARRDDVDIVEPDLVPVLVEPAGAPVPADKDAQDVGLTPGIAAIGADRVWRELGIDGTGVIVGIIDTGVDGLHPALAGRWHGNHVPAGQAWLDAADFGAPDFPEDAHYHGTHVMGTICGQAPGDSIGVAPGATWIASNAIYVGPGTDLDNAVLASLEFMADPDGDPATAGDVPAVVENSWGVDEGTTGYVDCDSRWWDAIDACEAAGVALVWSAGNDGPVSGSVRSPADRASSPANTFCVGATETGAPWLIADFSSRGPSGCGGEYAMKPEVSAPGVDILSATPGGGYISLSGTSMAGPHVAGVIALMVQANPDLDVTTIKQILMETARDMGDPGEDNVYGHGLIDAYAAVTAASADFGTIEGTVTDAYFGTPLQGARVGLPGTRLAIYTDQNGYYRIVQPVGTHDLVFSAFGFQADTLTVTLTDGSLAVADLVLERAPSALISGHVTGPDGQPVPGAVIRALDAQIMPVTADGTGFYRIYLPQGSSVTLHASGGGHGTFQTTVAVGADRTLDIALPRRQVEDFESRFFGMHAWQMAGHVPWVIDGTDSPEGTWCARSGDLDEHQLSILTLTLDVIADSDITFLVRSDTRPGFSSLTFFCDGLARGSWTGEVAWEEMTWPVSAGVHSFTWSFHKGSNSTGEANAAWIDFVALPTIADPVPPAVNEQPAALHASVYQAGSTSQVLTLENAGPGELRFAVIADTADLIGPGGGAGGLGGPDANGHYWFDETYPSSPAFDWVEISGTGQDLGAGDNTLHGPFDLGFSLDYYGRTVDQVYVCSNGWLSFATTPAAGSNTDLPRNWVPNGIVCPFWDDLDPTQGGAVYCLADTVNGRFIAQWDGLPHKGADPARTETFQCILDRKGFLFQYADVTDVGSCTVGIENEDGTVALQVAYNEQFLADGKVVYVRRVEPWLAVTPAEGTVASGASMTVTIDLGPGDLPLGVYHADISLVSNDPLRTTTVIPLTMTVLDPALSPVQDLPSRSALVGAFPNPFNPQTTIAFELPDKRAVSLSIYDVSGRLVDVLIDDEIASPGRNEVVWRGRDRNGRAVSAGVYFYRLDAGSFRATRKMVLVK